jgi:hypothetical protein
VVSLEIGKRQSKGCNKFTSLTGVDLKIEIKQVISQDMAFANIR